MHDFKIFFFELCPLSRQVRLLLEEKKIPYKLIYHPEWKDDFLFTHASYKSQLPSLTIAGKRINGWYSVFSYLEEEAGLKELFGENNADRGKVKEIILFMNDQFYNQVMVPLIAEKIISYMKHVEPDSRIIRSARSMKRKFLKFIEEDLKKFHWLSHNEFSAADLIAAAHISILDYMHEVNWQEFKILKDWYSIIKSRPSMRLVLKDRFAAFDPPLHYQDPDF